MPRDPSFLPSPEASQILGVDPPGTPSDDSEGEPELFDDEELVRNDNEADFDHLPHSHRLRCVEYYRDPDRPLRERGSIRGTIVPFLTYPGTVPIPVSRSMPPVVPAVAPITFLRSRSVRWRIVTRRGITGNTEVL